GEILVIADLGVAARQFQIDLAMVELEVRSDEVANHVDDARGPGDLGEGRGDIRGIVDPAKRRSLRPVLFAHVEAGPTVDRGRTEGLQVRPTLLDPVLDLGAHGGEFRRFHGIGHDEKAVPPKPIDLRFAQHGSVLGSELYHGGQVSRRLYGSRSRRARPTPYAGKSAPQGRCSSSPTASRG